MIKTIQELIDDAKVDFEAALPELDANKPSSRYGIIAKIVAYFTHSLYRFLDWGWRQNFPDMADDENIMRLANRWLDTPQIQAKKAQGEITLTSDSAVSVPQATQLNYNEVIYITDETVLVDGDTAAYVTAQEAGESSNLKGLENLQLVTPLSGVNSEAIVSLDGITGGAEVEAIDSIRNRLIYEWKNPSGTGKLNDYVKWAVEAHPNINRAWPYANALGDNTIAVYIASSNEIDPTLGQPVIDAAISNIEDKRPATVVTYVYSVGAEPIDFTIKLTPNTSQVQDSVTNAIQSLFNTNGMPAGRIARSVVMEAISRAAGESEHDLQTPAGDIVVTGSNLPVLGTITWTI